MRCCEGGVLELGMYIRLLVSTLGDSLADEDRLLSTGISQA